MTKVEEHLIEQIHDLREASFNRICILEDKYRRDISLAQTKYNVSKIALIFMTIVASAAILIPQETVLNAFNGMMKGFYE